MLAYAQEFDLELEDVNKVDGEVFYRFGDQDYSEAEIVDEYRAFVSTMQADLRALSGEVSAASFTDADRRIDLTSIDDYLAGDNADGTPAGELLSAVIRVAYCIEYGLETYDQSAINFLHFIHADKRSEFKPWGVFSDERWHIAGGNDQIAARIAEELDPVIELGMRLARVARASDGRVVLTFSDGARTVERTHDRVILAIPFSVLRSVELDPSLDLPAWKTDAINQFVVGASAKHMIGFGGRPWADLGGNGASYSDQVDLQCTWETNVSASSATRAVLTDFSGGDRAATLNPANAQTEARRFLDALEQVFPGSKAKASVSRGQYLTHLEHWPSNPYVLGGYSCYRPGQFTTIAGREGTAVGNVHFAGEHTDSFYSWQGFMEGACLSGLRTAAEVLDA
jgi:monoamine oxidase